MLPKINRFNIRKDFLALKKTGRMINSESFGLLYFVGDDHPVVPPSRFNFIVSTKISNKAVMRNLIKRRLRGIVRQMLPEFEKRNVSGVFLVKKTALGKTYQELHNEVGLVIGKVVNADES